MFREYCFGAKKYHYIVFFHVIMLSIWSQYYSLLLFFFNKYNILEIHIMNSKLYGLEEKRLEDQAFLTEWYTCEATGEILTNGQLKELKVGATTMFSRILRKWKITEIPTMWLMVWWYQLHFFCIKKISVLTSRSIF